MKTGLIIKSISGQYSVVIDDNVVICKPKGIMRYNDLKPKVGDKVDIDEKDQIITNIHPRKNDLIRPFISNVDKVFLVFSVAKPELNLNLLDRLLSIIEYQDIEVAIIFTKLDLLSSCEKEKYLFYRNYYQKIGYKIYENNDNEFLEKIKEEINDSICVVSGQSGVGKSTLINKINPLLNIKTAEISKALNRGKHTTRHVELIKINNGYLADTPGFGIADFDDIDILTLSHTFLEFYQNSSLCKYPQCTHVNEPNCQIKKLVEENVILKTRYENYLLFVEAIKEKKKNKY